MPQSSPLYLLERFEVGLVHLDAQRRVVDMNDFARRVLPVDQKQPFDRMVLSFHPERSQAKVEFLLDASGQCPVAHPPPMTMIINIPERVLLIKVSRLVDGAGEVSGFVLVFYDITDFVSTEAPAPAAGSQRRLAKIPTVANQKVVFVDVGDVLCIESNGHYTRVLTAQGSQFCNLAIGDIADRLEPEQFMRVHRSHLVNLHAVSELLREDGRVALRLDGLDTPVPVSRSSAAEVQRRLGLRGGMPVAGRKG
jgi:LytTR family transcriptional regulator, CO-responsive transcriptional regulator RcoM